MNNGNQPNLDIGGSVTCGVGGNIFLHGAKEAAQKIRRRRRSRGSAMVFEVGRRRLIVSRGPGKDAAFVQLDLVSDAQRRCAAGSRLAGARQEPSHYFLVRIAPKFQARMSSTTMELVLLGRLFGECRNLLFGLSLVLRKGHPFANDFSARLVVFLFRGSLACQTETPLASRTPLRVT